MLRAMWYVSATGDAREFDLSEARQRLGRRYSQFVFNIL